TGAGSRSGLERGCAHTGGVRCDPLRLRLGLLEGSGEAITRAETKARGSDSFVGWDLVFTPKGWDTIACRVPACRPADRSAPDRLWCPTPSGCVLHPAG